MAKVAIVGSGFIGRAWAISFARAGHEAALWDAAPGAADAALAYIEDLLPDLAAHDLLGGATPAEIRARMRPVATLPEAVEGAVHVQENTPERVELKQAVFAELDRLAAPEAVLASSTSAILPSRFTEGLAGRGRCLVAHPINPPYLIPAAEVVPAPWTDPAAVTRTADFLRAAGHRPIVMKRELDGFVMNRLQGALLEEAFRLVAEGYASVEDVDAGISDGLALRWSFMGPFETIDLNAPGGVRDYVERYESIYSSIFPTVQWRADWSGDVLDVIERERRERLPAEQLRERQAWRDRRLMALAAHKARAAREIGD
ncbi:3-hydroxyacyl-CoA dehydrogenase [Alsobacter sp. SYSU M60028]|uniref:3-hydroxyacyl-CoA dehydrogenase n=1 Tax=Alsobacter ponti TaxID=2962936 RepID=A0ABT1LFN7_9HYPH|nr:3-hydroxyacyl-CoA dehydrogenase [Alsobacter ponti]MCP8940306.1 3-hydroxyacyl-CoA dehydrogenase [Alsobacter ponti]